MRSNHRATDVVALEGVNPPLIPAKFQYGPLDMASLCKEEVRCGIMFFHIGMVQIDNSFVLTQLWSFTMFSSPHTFLMWWPFTQVEAYVLTENPKPMWEYMGKDTTDKHGKIMFDLSRAFSPGLYHMKFLVKYDNTASRTSVIQTLIIQTGYVCIKILRWKGVSTYLDSLVKIIVWGTKVSG